ncbi:outer membrane protein transport protein [Dechloromonas sp. XY25]|uniref:Outer membrane protein transport protein n=1 Tax=Dechloromonas hankyongensis TaxID=2908002 RepID=A0ABS9K2A3_9RHOO|nr:outer membrane protein transport protein [Dechloromonas hankyongensis]MCG2577278.1 outer membrane protein transport protein [Dechloromonas hankyongensis]
MYKTFNLRLIPALVAVAFSGSAAAAGFQLFGEQSASGIGNAGAGSAAVAENAGTIYYNPAGMTQLQRLEVSGGLSVVRTNFEFKDNGSSVGALGASGDGGNGGDWGYVPNAYMSMALNKDLYIGLGIGAPFGLKTGYDNPWKGAAQSLSFDIKTININPSVAWRANEWVSVGFGLNWQKIDAEYVRAVSVTNAGFTGATATLNLSDDAWGWNAGALFNLSPDTKLGVSYRSKIKYETTGDVKLSSNGSAASNVTVAGLTTGGGASDTKASITLPDTFILSLTQKLGNQWELLGDVSWTGWSSIPKVDIYRTSGVQNGALAQTLDTEFRDTWRVALGANYKVSEAVKLKMGIAYDQTPVKNAEHRLVSLPDNNRTWFGLGAQWKPSKTMTLDVGGAYLYVKDADINNNQTVAVVNAQTAAANRGTVKGTYNDSAWLFGAQVSLAF